MADAKGLTFTAAFAPGRKCFQADTDGEVTIVLVVPETDAPKLMAAFPLLKDETFTVTLKVGA